MATPNVHLGGKLPSIPLELLFKQLPVGICLLDAQLRIHYLNPVYAGYLERYLGLSPEAALGRPWLDLIPLGPEIRQQFRWLHTEGRAYKADALPISRPGRPPSYWDITLAPIEFGGETGLLISTVDVTSRVTAEQTLRKNQEQIHAILRHMAEGLLVIDEKGTIIQASVRASELLGQPLTRLIGLDIHQAPELANLRYPDGRPVPTEKMPVFRALRGETFHNEIYLVGEGTKTTALMISSAPVTSAEGFGSVVFRDITEYWNLRQKLEALVEERTHELSQAVAELRQLDHMKANFLNSVSHELRTPLTAITGFAEFLEEGVAGNLTPEQHGYVKQILYGTDRLLALINDLLDYARMEAGRFTLSRAPVEFPSLARNVASSLMPLARRSRLEVHVDVPKDLPEVDADPERVNQILTNLLSNAVKFTPAGGQIWLRARKTDHQVEIEVSDTGIGIPSDALPHLFSRFYQVDPSVPVRGIGLGLPITKGLIEAHGGQINVTSTVGKGSTFRFTLPLWNARDGS